MCIDVFMVDLRVVYDGWRRIGLAGNDGNCAGFFPSPPELLVFCNGRCDQPWAMLLVTPASQLAKPRVFGLTPALSMISHSNWSILVPMFLIFSAVFGSHHQPVFRGLESSMSQVSQAASSLADPLSSLVDAATSIPSKMWPGGQLGHGWDDQVHPSTVGNCLGWCGWGAVGSFRTFF